MAFEGVSLAVTPRSAHAVGQRLVAWIGSHSETDLAQSMGVAYTDTTCPLCEDYLSRFG